MFELKCNATKVVIVLHEIYGVNDHIKSYANFFAGMGYVVVCPNLLQDGLVFSYENEQQAYDNFMEYVGFKEAASQIKTLINELQLQYSEIIIVGFSIGATIAWLCSEEAGIQQIIGYYGSRIRNYLEIEPQCPVTLFYGKSEKSFDVANVIECLHNKEVQAFVFDGEHGFADAHSAKYNALSSDETFNHVRRILYR
ncbi:dienelactone hydrolase family protein [Solibacillus sp. CAU 1738]|uniref:dienelactone hydrolase family protein n=1 Tax=Solibacillus sp. CAU 1738 TaxID=3140363 RepID=UPI0032607403